MVADRESDGHPISGFDAQIAAICRSQAATLATRNTKDFSDLLDEQDLARDLLAL